MFKTENNHEEVHLIECFNTDKYSQLIEDIVSSDLSDEWKNFFKLAATRFIDLNYNKIAQLYYNEQDADIKNWFKMLNLVLVDDKDAIENGYIKLTSTIIKNLDKYIGKE